MTESDIEALVQRAAAAFHEFEPQEVALRWRALAREAVGVGRQTEFREALKRWWKAEEDAAPSVDATIAVVVKIKATVLAWREILVAERAPDSATTGHLVTPPTRPS
jgi:hypothetical protein